MFSASTCRRAAGLLFLTGNFGLFVTNLSATNGWQLSAALLFMSCSLALYFSARNHRWLFWGGFAVIIAYALVAVTPQDDGTRIQQIGSVAGVIGGLLVLRSALQAETGRQLDLPPPFNLLDEYPLAAAGVIEGSCCLLIAIGAALHEDWRLAIASLVWTLAHGLMTASDEPLRQRLA